MHSKGRRRAHWKRAAAAAAVERKGDYLPIIIIIFIIPSENPSRSGALPSPSCRFNEGVGRRDGRKRARGRDGGGGGWYVAARQRRRRRRASTITSARVCRRAPRSQYKNDRVTEHTSSPSIVQCARACDKCASTRVHITVIFITRQYRYCALK